MNAAKPITASVKVMRSFDYCHFEVCLSSEGLATIQEVDDLRKTAARLADKAVEQYKVAKVVAQRRIDAQRSIHYMAGEVEAIKAMPEGERTPDQQATLKAWQDHVFNSTRRYDYEDDWQDDDNDFDE